MFDRTSYLSDIERRTAWLRLAILAFLVIFAVRLFYVQVIRHDHYVGLARASQVTKLTIFPERGTISIRDGQGIVPLALNEAVYTVFADPYEVKDTDKVKDVLNRIAGGEVLRSSFDSLSDKSRRYLVLARQVSRAQAELIRKEDLAGVGLQEGARRVYPEGALAAQLLGYVNNDGVGQYGVEGFLNERLAGKTGLLQSVTDVRRIPLTIGSDNIDQPSVDGEDLVLSIDRSIQFKAEQFLAERASQVNATSASIIVMNPNNGQVVAMANTPSYDPANFTKVTDYNLFQNNVVSNAYEAGSVIKTLTVAAGLNAGVITPTSTSPNPSGCTNVEGRIICNTVRNGITNPTTQQLLTYSFNTGAVDVVRKLGGGSLNRQARDQLYDYFSNNLRLTSTTGIEQTGEAKGLMYAPSAEEGNNVRYSNMAFGQGMMVTMVQTAAAFSATINDGTYYQPTVLYGVAGADGRVTEFSPKVIRNGVIGANYSEQLRDMIWHARYDTTGKPIDPSGYKLGGKTGTSETIDAKTGEYTTDKTVGSYIGFVGVNDPQYVIMVRVDDATGMGVFSGSITANSTFTDLSHWMIRNGYIKK